MSESRPARYRHWLYDWSYDTFRDWTVWGCLALIVIPLGRILIHLVIPCKTPPDYYPPFHDPVVYSELISKHTFRCYGTLDLFALLAVLAIILLIFSKRSCLVIVSIGVAIFSYLVLFWLFFFLGDGAILEEMDSLEFDDHQYHLTKARVTAGDMDVYYESLFLHECDLKDADCYGREITEFEAPNYEEASLVINEAADQLEVWADGEMIYTVDADD